MGLLHDNSNEKIETLLFSKQKIVGMFCGYFFCTILVEHPNGERQVVGWGHDS